MAHIIDSPRTYLNGNIVKSQKRARNVLLFVFLITGFALPYFGDALFSSSLSNIKRLTFPIFLVCYFILAGVLLFWFNRKTIEVKRWQSGTNAEISANKFLQKLSNDFTVIADVVLPSKRGNIDFVVISEHSIISLEVKGHKGNIDVRGNKIIRNGSYFSDRDIIKQAKTESALLQKFLLERTGILCPIKPIIFFNHHLAVVPGRGIHVDGVAVLGKESLLNFVEQLFLTAKPLPVERLVLALKPYIGS